MNHVDLKTEPHRLPDRDAMKLEKILVIIFAIGTGLLATIAMASLIDGEGITVWGKAIMIGLMASVVSYGVNHFAIEKGAVQAATGYVAAAIVSLASILIVGIGLFASSYAGLTISPVRTLTLSDHGEKLKNYVTAIDTEMSDVARIVPLVEAAAADQRGLLECELSSGCLNARGIPGAGPVTRALENLVRRSEAVANQVKQSESDRDRELTRINGLLGEYQSTLSASSKSHNERRRELSRIDAEFHQAVGALRQSTPLSIVQAYTSELEIGVSIADRPASTQAVNGVLRKYGASINTALSSLEAREVAVPQFPANAGVSDTFVYIGHFFPIAVLTAGVELVLPLTLWVYAWLDIVWSKHKLDHSRGLPERLPQAGHHHNHGDRRRRSSSKSNR